MSQSTRRTFGKLMLTLPAASLAVPGIAEEKPPELADVLAAREPGLSEEERGRLRKLIGDAQKPLQVVRDFKLPEDVAPAFRFQPLRKARS
jgi:hypothetical protein